MEQALFWGVNKKLTWKKMQMGAFNVSLFVGVIILALKQECQSEVEHQDIRDRGLEVIMDDIVLLKICLTIILHYFEVVL